MLDPRWYCVSARCRVLFLSVLAALSASAQPAPKLNSISVDRFQRGTSAEITLNGENLGLASIVVVDGDIGAVIALNPAPAARLPLAIESTGGGILRVDPPADLAGGKRLTAKIAVEAAAALGPREVRVVTPHGVSNPVAIQIGQFPEISEKGPNNGIGQAQLIALPAVVSGRIGGAGEVDYYKFKAGKGAELIFEVEAFRRGSPLDSSLSLLNANGEELARSEDSLGLDSLITFVIPADGEYLIALRDFRYQGGGNYSYRLSAGALPHIHSIFPFGGQRGRRASVTLTGSNLSGTTNLLLDISASAPLGREEIRASTPNGLSNPHPFDVSDYPDFMEAEPNDGAGQPNSVSVPVVINGRIGAENDEDRFTFKSDKNQRLVCAIIARRFGSRLDALLTLLDANGAVLQQNDDADGADARFEFDAKKDQEYTLLVRDLTGRGGEHSPYRLEVRPPAASESGFTARFLPDTVRVHRGGHTTIRCEVTRLAGFNGPVRFSVEELPAGVFCETLVLSTDPSSALLTLSASKAAALGSFPINVIASGMAGGKELVVTAEALSGDKPVRQAYLTVLDEAPFALVPVTSSASAEQGQTATLDLFVQRNRGFAGDVKLFAEGFSAGRDPITKNFDVPEAIVKANDTVGRLALKPKTDSETGTRTVVIRGEAIVSGITNIQYSRQIPVSVSQLPFLLSSTLSRLSVVAWPSASQSAARETATLIRVDRRAGFTNEVQLSIEGLPAGIESVLDKIPAGAGETTLKLVVDETSPSNTNFTFRVVGTGMHKDRNYRRQTGNITLSIAAPEPEQPASSAAVPGAATAKTP